MPVIGLTGNFGMGKTSILQLFHELGAHTFNIDAFVAEILVKPGIIKKLAKALGNDILSRSIRGVVVNKKRVAQIIFSDPTKRKAAESIIHPEVLKKMKQVQSLILKKDPSAYIVFEVPLLFEAGYDNHFDKTIVVHCRKATAIKRLMEKGFSREEAESRMRTQMPITRKKKLADYRIDNNRNIQSAKKAVRRIMNSLSLNIYS